MGIYDREYYREKTRGSGFFSGVAPACKAIIAINLGLFVMGTFLNEDNIIERWFGATSVDIFQHGQVWRLLTATFLHEPHTLFHIAFNMLFLWMVGREMEAFYGTKEFTWLYLSAAVVSTLCWALVNYVRGRQGIMIGASGAVMAVVAVYTFYYPKREVIFFIFPVEMRLLLGIYVVSDALQLFGRSNEPIAFAAHLGGVAYAFAFKSFDLRLKHLREFLPKSGPKLRLVHPPDPPIREVPKSRPTVNAGPTWSPSAAMSTRPAPTVVVSEESLEARLDEILVKIASQGRDSLTDEEKRILEEASRRARNRRGGRV